MPASFAAPRFVLRRLALASALVFGAALPAQEQPATEPTAPAAPPALARVEVDKVPLRCFAHENSPLFVDQLQKGDVVQVGEQRDGFVQVSLPLGVTGYVHTKFATPPDEQGFVRTNGKRVSFRYRPRSTEAPADALDDGVALHFMAQEEDWYLVRNPRTSGYVPLSALALDVDAAEAQAAWTAFETRRREEWTRRTTERVEAARRADEMRTKRADLQKLVDDFGAEVAKPWEKQRRDAYVALEAALGQLAGVFEDGSGDDLRVTGLGQEIRKQILVLDAQAVAKETLPPPNQPVKIVEPRVEDPLARFDLVGWIRVVDSSLPNRSIRLIRGGRVMGYLTCTSERYDLPLFSGVEVGVVGPKEAAADGTWILDVQRMDVLGVPIR